MELDKQNYLMELSLRQNCWPVYFVPSRSSNLRNLMQTKQKKKKKKKKKKEEMRKEGVLMTLRKLDNTKEKSSYEDVSCTTNIAESES